MCLILFALKTGPDHPLVIAANRDEFYGRPTAAAAPWPDAPQIVGGRDLREGGSWLGITLDGRWAAVTNFRDASLPRSDAPSRGHLVGDFLRGDLSPANYIEQLRPSASSYNGFNLLVGDPRTVVWYSNRSDDHPLLATPLPPGIYGLSNHLLDTPWPKIVRGKRELAKALAPGADPEAIMETLLDRTLADDADLPSTGIPLEQERALSALFIAGEAYGTRSSTVVLMRGDGRTVLVERAFHPVDGVEVHRHHLTIPT
jgi:uncharacterized protein with NRDE domain